MAGLRQGPSGRLLTGTIDGQVLTWSQPLQRWIPDVLDNFLPGAPVYDVTAAPFSAANNLAADDTNALSLAYTAANAAPGVIYLGSRHRVTGALPPLLNNNIMVVGRGPFNGGTIVQVDSPTPVDAMSVLGCQYSGFSNMWIAGTRLLTSGNGIKLTGGYRLAVENVLITGMGGGVEVDRCTLTSIRQCNLGDLYGPNAHYAHGLGGSFNHAVKYQDCVCGTNYPLSIAGQAAPWAQNTLYVTGQIVTANGNIYQCLAGGTSSLVGTGPSGLPGTTPNNVHTTPIADGSTFWVFAMPAAAWWKQGSWSHTFEVLDCGALQGAYGCSVDDEVPASGSAPLFFRSHNFQIDHPLLRGMRFLAGSSHRNSMSFVTSVMGGSGIEIGPGVAGWEFEGGEIFGCADAGALIGSGLGGILHGLQMDAIGARASNTRDCIEVAAGVSNFALIGNRLGNQAGGTSTSRYGASIGAGADRYSLVGNIAPGNATGGFLNTPGASATRVLTGNVGSVT